MEKMKEKIKLESGAQRHPNSDLKVQLLTSNIERPTSDVQWKDEKIRERSDIHIWS